MESAVEPTLPRLPLPQVARPEALLEAQMAREREERGPKRKERARREGSEAREMWRRWRRWCEKMVACPLRGHRPNQPEFKGNEGCKPHLRCARAQPTRHFP